jgi:hypothetical protein
MLAFGRAWHGTCVYDKQIRGRRSEMVYILLWLLGVPLGLIVLLFLLGVFR